MGNVTVEIELSGKLSPQLIVISAACQRSEDGPIFIENHCCMVSTSDELDASIEGWIEELEQAGYKIVNAVVRHVPRSVFHGAERLWAVVKVTSADGKQFEFQGVFSSEERAIEACKGPNWFVAPAILDKELPQESHVWPNGYYPLDPRRTKV